MESFASYAEAKAAAPEGWKISAARPAGQHTKWRYFPRPPQVEDLDITERAFEVLHGQPMEPMQKYLVHAAEAGDL